jgi:hypothetical protein
MRSILTALGIGLLFFGKISVGVFHVFFTSIYQNIRTIHDQLQRDWKQLRTRQDDLF